MSPRMSLWLVVLLGLPALASAEESPSPTSAPAPAGTVLPMSGTGTKAAPASFDLRSAAVRDVIRNVAATQVGTGYRIESRRAVRTDADLAALLREPREPPPEPPAKPQLPMRPAPCDGFFSCGLESLLGLEDFDDETYARAQRNRLLHEGSFTDRSKINATFPLAPSPAEAAAAGAPHRP